MRASTFLGGYSRMTQGPRQFLLKAAVVSRVADAAQLQMMKDGRLALTLDLVEDKMVEALDYIAALSHTTWQSLAKLSSQEAGDLRDMCISGGSTTFAFSNGGWSRIDGPHGVSLTGILPATWPRSKPEPDLRTNWPT